MKTASFGSISTGTLRSQDLLRNFFNELEWQIHRNGDYFCRPENFNERDKLNNLLGEVQDCYIDEDIDLNKIELAEHLIQELQDALQFFAPTYSYFGAHFGDGSDFGFWPLDIEEIKEQVEFVSSKYQEYPDEDFIGEWLHINERGNCTLYFRENGNNKEIWSIV